MLESLFRPKSAAVIGASSKELSIGNRVIKNLIDFGFKGCDICNRGLVVIRWRDQ